MSKIQFADPRTIKTVSLPSFPGAEVSIYEKLLVGQQEQIRDRFPNAIDEKHPDAQKALIAMVATAIKEWNFTDENNQDLKVSEDILKKFPEQDLVVLIQAVVWKQESDTEAKKKE